MGSSVPAEHAALFPGLARRMNAYWRAAKYPSGGQIYVLWLYSLPEIRNWPWNSPGGS